jgi:N4-gp56 family major capsid protein
MLVRRDFDGEISQSGDTVHFTRFGNIASQTKQQGTDLTAKNETATKVTISIDQDENVAFSIEKRAELQTRLDLAVGYGKQAGETLAYEMDVFLAALAAGATVTQNVGATNSSGTYLDITDAIIREARKILNQANAPFTDRVLIVSPEQESVMLGLDKLVRADAIGNGNAIETGFLGKIYGFDVYVFNGLYDAPAVASSSGASAIAAYKVCIAMQKGAIGLGMQQAIGFNAQYMALGKKTDIVYDTLYGGGVLEPGLLVQVRTTDES